MASQRLSLSGTRNGTKLAVSLGLALALAACGGGDAQQQGAPPPPQVNVANPLQREVVDWDEYTGRFEAIQDVELRPRVSGQIETVNFDSGQFVRQGAVLFTIDPRPYRAALGQARAQTTSAEATLANARSQLARAQKLFEAQAVSREEFEQLQADVRTAAATLASARAAQDAAELNLSFTTVRAPVGGRVSDRRVSRGNYVAQGETVLTRIVSVSPIWFTFDGAESFYLKYRRQDTSGERGSSRDTANPVQIQLADESGWNWTGTMDFVDNAIDPNSGTIRAHAVIQNPDGFLTPGMFGRARLLGSGTYRAMLVPDEAIVTDQARKLVYTVDKDGKVAPRPIETGPPVEGLRVVKEGLAPTDRVIITGITALQPGMPVQAKLVKMQPRARDSAPVSRPVSAPPAAEAAPAS